MAGLDLGSTKRHGSAMNAWQMTFSILGLIVVFLGIQALTAWIVIRRKRKGEDDKGPGA